LGTTIPAIAREKAAIIERGDVAVTGAHGEALAVIRRRARRLGVPLAEVSPAPLHGWDRDGIDVELPRLGRTRVGLRGRHQAANVAVADALLDVLATAGIAQVDAASRRAGFAAAVWPGRLELLRVDDRDVLLDGAHNPAGAVALATALDDLRPFLADGPLTLVTASMSDKDVDGVVAALAASASMTGATIICTSLEVDRAMPATDLAARWRQHLPSNPVMVESAAATALDLALHGPAAGAGPMVVAGSLYLVGLARGRWVDDPDLRDPEPPEDA
jgi:dihydrofolate synthase/folylpolyglutamate synthase